MPPSLSHSLISPSRTTRSRRAQSRHRTRCTPLRYGAIGWWPHRCQRVPASPPAPSVPAPSSAGYLEGTEDGWMSQCQQFSTQKFKESRFSFTRNTSVDTFIKLPTFSQTLTSTYGGQEVGACVAHRDHPQHGGLPCRGCSIHS